MGAAAAEPTQARQQRQPPALIAAGSAATTQGLSPEQASVTAPSADSPILPASAEGKEPCAAWDFSFPGEECALHPPQQTATQPQTPLPAFECAFSTDMGAFSTAREPPKDGDAGARSGATAGGSPTMPAGSPLGRGDRTPILAPLPPPQGGAAWIGGTMGDFPLLLPKREAPPPPLLQPYAPAHSLAWHASSQSQDIGHQLRGLHLSEGSEAGSVGQGGDDVAATWRPMRQADKDSCHRAFHAKVQRPFALLQHVLHVCTPDASFFSKESECQVAPVSSCHVVIARVTATSHSLHPPR